MNAELLARIVNTPGISGWEEGIQEVVAAELSACCDVVRGDRMGNVIGLKTGSGGPRVVLAAHCDEIGMLVKYIEPEGFLRFQPVGGLCAQALTSHLVVVHGRRAVKGVIVPDMAAKEIPSPQDMLIDLGLPREEVERLVEPGDPITLAQELVQINDKVVMGRNFDDRIGVFCMIEAMRRAGPTVAEVHAVSTVQEEVGVRGMPVAAYAIEPDLGLAIDGSVTRGAFIKPHQYVCEMGKGAGIYVIDNLTIANKGLLKFLYNLCERHGVAYQKNIGGGTDASALQRSKAGVICTTVGAPVRYMHTTVQLCHVDDIEATIELLRLFVEHAHEFVGGGA